MSPSHALILFSFYSSLETGRSIYQAYDTSLYSEKKGWKKAFRRRNKERIGRARVGMMEDYGSAVYWEEIGKGREGVWDIALSELGGWLMRDLPGSGGSNLALIGNQFGGESSKRVLDEQGEGQYQLDLQTFQSEIVEDHLKMTASIVGTKILSLVTKITRPDSASDSWPGRYRYKALTIKDMVKLSVLISRSPLPLRQLLHSEIRSIAAEIVVLFDELEGAECEWVRLDDVLAWDLECVQKGLGEVGLDHLWDGVVSTWSKRKEGRSSMTC
jgi:hypothetical protein